VRAFWLLLGLSLTAVSGYVFWYWTAERAANSPPTFLNLVAAAGTLSSTAAGLALAQAFARSPKPPKKKRKRRSRSRQRWLAPT
jgi:hypothetical protein